ncbi:hypothetical protein [Psychroserpens sp.]|uniref:hypothetical protein n=1 Tax=Psychroserpens sp. TaxID=2020870 RepID=UPI0039E5B736
MRQLDKEVKTLEEKLLLSVKESHRDLFTRIKTIPVIGRKIAIMLIVQTGGFECF